MGQIASLKNDSEQIITEIKTNQSEELSDIRNNLKTLQQQLQTNITSQHRDLTTLRTYHNKLASDVSSLKSSQANLHKQLASAGADINYEITTLKSDGLRQHTLNTQVSAKLQDIENQNSKMNETLLDMTSELSLELANLTQDNRHIEQGTLFCTGDSGWTEGDHGIKYIIKKFSQPYAKTPKAICYMHEWSSDVVNKLHFAANVIQVNTTHLILGCYKWNASVGNFLNVINWISFPQ